MLGVLALLASGAGCTHYTGGAEPITPAHVRASEGWTVVPPTPLVRQRDLADCGAATLTMVVARWGHELTLEKARRLLPAPTKEGVRMGAVRDALRAQGLVAYAIEGDAQILMHELGEGRPVVVGLLRPISSKRASSHFEVVVALRRDEADGSAREVVTLDPGSGWLVRDWGEFEQEWKPAGRPVLVVLGKHGEP